MLCELLRSTLALLSTEPYNLLGYSSEVIFHSLNVKLNINAHICSMHAQRTLSRVLADPYSFTAPNGGGDDPRHIAKSLARHIPDYSVRNCNTM